MIYREFQEINPYVRICVCTRTNPHWAIHNRIIYDHQFVLTSRGRGTVIMDGRTYPASKGDLFLIKPGVVHSFVADPEAPFEMLVIHFDFFYERDRNFWPHKKYELSEGETQDCLPEKYLLREVPVFDKKMTFPDYIRLQNYTPAEVLMKKLIDMNSAVIPGKELIVKSYFLEFLYLIYMESLGVGGRTDTGEVNGFEKIRKAYEFINERYMEDLKLETLAKLCSLSTNYFSAVFKQNTGYSPKEYISRLRIERAKTLLAQGDEPVTEIGDQVGFHDIHYFSLYFKKFEGVSPTQYRAMVRGEGRNRPLC